MTKAAGRHASDRKPQIRLTLFQLIVGLLCLCAPQTARAQSIQTIIEHHGSGGVVTFHLPGEMPVWVFPRSGITYGSGEPWRPTSWTVITDGVELVRRNDLDALVLAPGSSRTVQVAFEDFAEPLRADYEPAIVFAGGDRALFTGQFLLSPFPSVDSIRRDALAVAPAILTFKRPGATLLADGRSATDEIIVSSQGAETYVFIGDTPLIETQDLVAVIDEGMPDWVQSGFRDFTPKLLAYYADRMGLLPGARPTLYVAWAGLEGSGISTSGNALPKLIVADIGGAALAEPSVSALEAVEVFIAHETAHLWIGQSVTPLRSEPEAWVHEGGADAASFRAVSALLGAEFDIKARFQRALDRCSAALTNGPLKTALARGDPRANYNCGAVFTLVAETEIRQLNPDFDALDFWSQLLDRTRERGRFEQADWIELFKQLGGSADTAALIVQLANEGSDQPVETLAAIFEQAGLKHNRTAEGAIKIICVPVTGATGCVENPSS